jgi:cold shock CspA family protein
MDGIVRSFSAARGYGFLQPLIGKPDVEWIYFHVSSLKFGSRALPVGARVRFVLCDGSRGRPQAADVELIRLSGAVLTANRPAPQHS